MSVVAFVPKTTHLPSLQQALQAQVSADPEFFDNDAVLIDLAQVQSAEEPIDFVALSAMLRQYQTLPVAVRGGTPEQMHAALQAGLATAAEEIPVRAAPPARPTEPRPAAAAAAPTPTPPPASNTIVIDKPLRSGQQVYARGADLIVLDMVSFGAEVIADGNIHVYAPLRGRAIAGARGNSEARIFSTCLEPQLLSIAGIYRTSENALPPEVASKAAQVYLEGEKMLIKPLS